MSSVIEVQNQISILQNKFNVLLDEYKEASLNFSNIINDMENTVVQYKTLKNTLTENNCKYECDHDTSCIKHDFSKTCNIDEGLVYLTSGPSPACTAATPAYINTIETAAINNPKCIAFGQQSNGCWQLLQWDSSVTGSNKKKRSMYPKYFKVIRPPTAAHCEYINQCSLYKYSIDSQQDNLINITMKLKNTNKSLYAINEELSEQYDKLDEYTNQTSDKEEDIRKMIQQNFIELNKERAILVQRDDELLLSDTTISNTNSSILFSKFSIIVLIIISILLIYVLFIPLNI